MKKLKIIALVLVGMGIVGAIVAYKMYNMPHKNFATEKADFELTAQAIFDEFNADETAATTKYVTHDQTIQITGFVANVSQDNDSTTTIGVSATAGEAAIANCSLAPEFVAEAASLKTGDPITIKGQCTGFMGLIDPAVMFIRCAPIK
ncbi:MAG: hypothetical protein RIS47_1672 [Bacteroidota bacterium]|jgi:Tfp pilus assembly protein PilV